MVRSLALGVSLAAGPRPRDRSSLFYFVLQSIPVWLSTAAVHQCILSYHIMGYNTLYMSVLEILFVGRVENFSVQFY